MDYKLNNPKHILDHHISGFHQYVLTAPVHLCYAGSHLCKMLGASREELLHETKDLYVAFVHPSDRALYSRFLEKLKRKEQTLTAQYRLVKKDGTVFTVSDTMTSQKNQEGILLGDSVLTDITSLKDENRNLQFLNETLPCGFIKYTCEKHPRVTFLNQKMQDFLGFSPAPAGEVDYLELFKHNIYLMIPREEHQRFAGYLERVCAADSPLAGEITVLRCDGTRARLFGWVAKVKNAQGIEEFQSVCMDITERYQTLKVRESQRYLKALTDVYDKIFAYDLEENTVECLYSSHSPMFKHLENIPMHMVAATEKWIADTVIPEDQERVQAFFNYFSQKGALSSDEKPAQITYRAKSSDNEIKTYRGIFLFPEEAVSLYCCRCVAGPQGGSTSSLEYEALKESMQELAEQFTDGIAAFRVTADNLVTPLYASDNVCEFFGFTKEEWLPMMEQEIPFKAFTANSEADFTAFEALLRTGEAEFTYFDSKTEAEKRIKAICSRKNPSESASRYVMLYTLDAADTAGSRALPENPAVTIRTFGYFDVFVEGRPIAWRSQKSKELFALLVDRRGGFISSEEAISFLWEDEPVNPVTLSRYRKVALRLKNILEEYGISHVVEAVDGKRRIVTEKVKCDLYDYLSGREEAIPLFKGSYLSNYSWGENTLAELTGNMLY